MFRKNYKKFICKKFISKEIYRKKQEPDPKNLLIVTEKVQEGIKIYCEIIGQKQVFAGEEQSFLGNLNSILSGFKQRPTNGGPYKLVICYKHKGNAFYRTYFYNEKEILIRNLIEMEDKALFLLKSHSQDLSFNGGKLKLSKTEFASRFKKLPILAEIMRMNMTQKDIIKKKTPIELSIEIMHKGKSIATITFDPSQSHINIGEESKELLPVKYSIKDDHLFAAFPAVHKEDTLAEIKTKTIEELNMIRAKFIQDNPNVAIPSALDPNIYLNPSLQLCSVDKILNEFSRLFMIVSLNKL